MAEEQPSAIDISEEETRLQLFPTAPLLSSRDSGWNIWVEHCCQPSFQTPELCHQQYVVAIHIGTPIRLRQIIGEQTQTLWVKKGDVFLAPPGFCRQYHWDREAEFIVLYLDSDIITRAAQGWLNIEQVEILPRSKERDHLIEGIGLALKTELELNQAGSQPYANSLANTLAAHLLWRYSAQPPPLTMTREVSRQRLQRSIDYICSHFAEELSLEAIANEAGISQYHFARLFKEFTGLAPHQYVNQCRIDRAKQLLLQPDLKVQEVATQVGLADASHFTKLFRQLTGMTPKAYRKR